MKMNMHDQARGHNVVVELFLLSCFIENPNTSLLPSMMPNTNTAIAARVQPRRQVSANHRHQRDHRTFPQESIFSCGSASLRGSRGSRWRSAERRLFEQVNERRRCPLALPMAMASTAKVRMALVASLKADSTLPSAPHGPWIFT
jgi:hypothetical protein